MARSTDQVLQDHITALQNGDFAALMADYADDAVLMTMDGAFAGKDAVQGWFGSTLGAMPNARVWFTGSRVEGEYALVTWAADSDVASVSQGVDTFVVTRDKIRLQTVWFTVTPK
jgi:ketosteroid isomerase-like protein